MCAEPNRAVQCVVKLAVENCVTSHRSERYNYRVELGKHSLEAAEEGSEALRAALIISHEDYNILLSR